MLIHLIASEGRMSREPPSSDGGEADDHTASPKSERNPRAREKNRSAKSPRRQACDS